MTENVHVNVYTVLDINGKEGKAMNVEIIKKKAFQGIGLKWIGTFEQAAKGEIKQLHQDFKLRLKQMKNILNAETILGISYHIDEKSFMYHYLVEVESFSDLGEGMERVSIPENTYASVNYNGYNVQDEYVKLYKWIEENGYELNQGEINSLELFPIDYDPFKDPPHLSILIPIKK